MSTVARARVVIILIFTAVLAVLLVRLLTGSPTAESIDGTAGADAGDEPEEFTIAGSAQQLFSPGETVALDLAISNPHDVAMTVIDLEVIVREVNAPNAEARYPCTLVDFTVVQAPSELEISVPANATSALSRIGVPEAQRPRVGMLDRPVNQDGCKGASLTLEYTASGVLK